MGTRMGGRGKGEKQGRSNEEEMEGRVWGGKEGMKGYWIMG